MLGNAHISRELQMREEILISGFMLRRVESGIQMRELAWIAARPERYRAQANEKAFITRISVRLLEEEAQPREEVAA